MQINIYIKKDTIVVLTRHACQCLVVLAAKKLKRGGGSFEIESQFYLTNLPYKVGWSTPL